MCPRLPVPIETAPILEMARAYGLRPRLWLLLIRKISELWQQKMI